MCLPRYEGIRAQNLQQYMHLIVGIIMKVASSDDVGLVLVLGGCCPRPRLAYPSADVWQGGAFANLSRVERGEIL